jgi:putative FmdB family regulatory protein
MPTYEYRCNACGHELEIFQSMKDAPKRKCPECGKNALERKIGTGGAIIFKGGGFYETDYRRAGEKAPSEDAAPAGESKSETKAETPAPAAESKPAKSESKGGAKKKDK